MLPFFLTNRGGGGGGGARIPFMSQMHQTSFHAVTACRCTGRVDARAKGH